jgi:hypothetical protein
VASSLYTFVASTISQEEIVVAANIRLKDDKTAMWQGKVYAMHETPRIVVFRQDKESMKQLGVVTNESIYDWND